MIIAFTGNLGSGKTLGMTVWAWHFSLRTRSNLLSNLPYRPEAFQRHKKAIPGFWLGYLEDQEGFVELAKRGGGIIAWDEIHQSIDSRSWARKTQVYFTQFLMYLRKLDSPLFLTTQSLGQIDVRVRSIIDFVVYCERYRSGFLYLVTTADGRVLRRSYLRQGDAKQWFSVFDSYRIVRPVEFPATEREYVRFLDRLQGAIPKRRQPKLSSFFGVQAGDQSDDSTAIPVPVS